MGRETVVNDLLDRGQIVDTQEVSDALEASYVDKKKATNVHDRLATEEANEWAKLSDRRSAVISLLRSVCDQLRKIDNPPLSRSDEAEGTTWAAQTKYAGATSADWSGRQRLSWRGVELAETLFDHFDTDGDGCWTYGDFRRYLEGVGRPGEVDAHVMAHREVWRCYMDDLFGTSHEGLVCLEHFVNYREYVEHRFPVEKDVLALGLLATPRDLDRWRTCLERFDELDRELNKEVYGIDEPTGKVAATSFQQLCYDCGECLSYEECALSLRVHLRKNALMTTLREDYKARHLFSFHQESRVDGRDGQRIYRDAFAAWWLSSRETLRPLAPFAGSCCGALLGFRTWLRRSKRNVGRVMGLIASFVDRGLITPERLARLKEDHAKWDFAVEIGDEAADFADADGNMSIEVEYEHVDDPGEFHAKMQVPGTCGSSICVDFPAKDGADPREVMRLRKLVVDFIHAHLEDDLAKLPYFHGVRVIRPVGGAEDEGLLLRLQFLWKKEGNLDNILRNVLKLGQGLRSLIPEMQMSARSGLSMEDLYESTKIVLGYDASIRLSGRATLARSALALLLEELLHAGEEARAVERSEKELKWKAHELAKARTLKSHGDLLKPGELPLTGITGHVKPEHEATDVHDAARAAEDATWTEHLWALCRGLKATRATSLEFSFHSLNELFLGNSAVLSALPAAALPGLRAFLEPYGGPALCWAAFRDRLSNEIAASWAAVDEAEAAEAARLEAKAKADADAWAAMTREEKRRQRFIQEKAALQAKLGSRVADATGDARDEVQVDEEKESDVHFAQRMRQDHARHLREALELYRLAAATLYGVSQVTLHSNKSKVEIAIEGLDIFDPLP